MHTLILAQAGEGGWRIGGFTSLCVISGPGRSVFGSGAFLFSLTNSNRPENGSPTKQEVYVLRRSPQTQSAAGHPRVWGMSVGTGIDWDALRGSGAAGTHLLLRGVEAWTVLIVPVSPADNPEVNVREASRFKQKGFSRCFCFHWSAYLGVGLIDHGSTLAVLPAHLPSGVVSPALPYYRAESRTASLL